MITLRRLLWALAGLLLLLSVSLGWLLLSTNGARFAIGQLQHRLAEGTQIGAVEGTLWQGLTLQAVEFNRPELQFQAARLAWRWELSALWQGQLHLLSLELDQPRLVLPASPPAGDQNSPAVTMPLAVRLDRFAIKRGSLQQGEAHWPLQHASGALSLRQETLQLHHLEAASPDGQLQLQGEVVIQAPYPLQLKLDWQAALPELGPSRGSAQLSGDSQQIQLRHQLQAPFTVTTDGTVSLSEAQPSLALQGKWSDLHWPIQGEAEYRSPMGSYQLAGPLDALQIKLDGRLEHPHGEALPLQFTGQLRDTAHLTVEQLRLSLLEGELLAQGDVHLSPQLKGDLRVTGRGINSGLLNAEWPGLLGFSADISAQLEGDQPQAEASIEQLQGNLRGYPVAARGKLQYRNAQLSISGLNLESGPNRLQADGLAWPRFALDFKLNTPQLAALWPGLAGSASAEGRVTGRPESPQLKGKLSAAQLRYDTWQLQQLEGEINWNSTATQAASSQLRLQGLSTPAGQFDQAQLELAGSPEKHRLQAQLTGPRLAALLKLNGGLTKQAWRGQIETLQLDPAALGEWRNAAPTLLQLSSSEIKLAPLCLVQQQSKLCSQLDWRESRGLNGEISLDEVDFALLQPFMPETLRVQGKLNGQATLAGTLDDPQLVATLTPGPGSLRFLDSGDPPLEVAFADAGLELKYINHRLTAKAGLALPEQGEAQLALQLAPPDSNNRRALSGQAKAEFPSLELIAGFLPRAQLRQGRLSMDARLSGDLEAPSVEGQLQVVDAIVDYTDLGIRLEQLTLSARNRGEETLKLTGSARSGQGQLAIEGEIQLQPKRHWPFQLTVNGEAFQVARLAEVQATASPQLRINGTTQKVLVDGRIVLPEINIELRELPVDTVQVSDDEVIVGLDEENEQQPLPTGRVTGDLQIVLGDQVRFKGFGLSTRLDGQLQLQLREARPTEAHGVIKLREGIYKAYGQDLRIERGQLQFSGTPENPYLDVHALRISRDEKVKAYLQLTGPLKKPTTRIYSQPALEQTEVLAYLLTGSPLDQSGQNNSDMMLQAAGSLGLEQALPALRALKQQTGLDELQVKSGSGLESAALVGGKYLNPDLYLSYAQGLFDPQGTLSLKYRLTDQLSIETRSGTGHSVDLIYSYERD